MKTRSIKYLTTSIFWYLVKMWSVLFLAKFSYLDCWKRDLFYFCQDFYFWHQVKTWSVFISGNIWQRGIPFLHFSGKFHQSSCTLQPTMAEENYCNYIRLFKDNQTKNQRMNNEQWELLQCCNNTQFYSSSEEALRACQQVFLYSKLFFLLQSSHFSSHY